MEIVKVQKTKIFGSLSSLNYIYFRYAVAHGLSTYMSKGGVSVKGAKHERSELALDASPAHVTKFRRQKKKNLILFLKKVETDAWLMHNKFRKTTFAGSHASVSIL